MINFITNIFNFENLNLNCFRPKTRQANYFNSKILETSKHLNITLLPITPNIEILNLYPLTNKVEGWSTLIVGNDLSYIVCHLNDKLKEDIDENDILNKKGQNILNDELNEFFNTIYEMTLKDKKLQFLMTYKNTIYFVFTYPIYGDEFNKKIIGCLTFLRPFNDMNKIKFLNHNINPQIRKSSEF